MVCECGTVFCWDGDSVPDKPHAIKRFCSEVCRKQAENVRRGLPARGHAANRWLTCARKRRYETEKAAAAAARGINTARNARSADSPRIRGWCNCEHCNGWHLTTRDLTGIAQRVRPADNPALWGEFAMTAQEVFGVPNAALTWPNALSGVIELARNALTGALLAAHS